MSKKVSAIENEILKATGEAKKDGEATDKYVGRIVRKASNLEDKQWAALSEPTQKFCESVVLAINTKGATPIPDFPDYVEGTAEEGAPVAKTAPAAKPKVAAKEKVKLVKEEDTDDEPATEGAEGGATTEAKEVANTEAAAEAPKSAAKEKKKRGAIDYFRKIQIQNPKMAMNDLVEKTVEAGFGMAPSTAYVVYYETRNTMKTLRELGMLPAEPEEEAPTSVAEAEVGEPVTA